MYTMCTMDADADVDVGVGVDVENYYYVVCKATYAQM